VAPFSKGTPTPVSLGYKFSRRFANQASNVVSP
jgi:hypothetical protein